MYHIDSVVEEKDYPEIVSVWEDSVKSTHYFLSEDDIKFFKPLILNEYLQAVTLACVKNANQSIVGFVGVANKKIEMLFISPSYQGKGIGKKLLSYAIDILGASDVDVNEQNEQATGFYQHEGFKIIGRSDLDGLGKPFPLLHLRLSHFTLSD